jgi:hypothetical protein
MKGKPMLRTRSYFILSVLMAGLLIASASAEDKAVKGKYLGIEVTKFDVQEGIQFPAEFQVSLVEDLVEELENMKKFKQVLRPGEQPSDASAPALKVTGIITEYKAGSRAKRYLVGFGAGKTKIVAQVKIADRATGDMLLERKMDGKVVMGAIGGNSMGATKGLAKEVVKNIKAQFF